MKKFTHLQRMNEREEVLANLPQNVGGVQTDTVTVTTSVESQPFGQMGTQSTVQVDTQAPKQTQAQNQPEQQAEQPQQGFLPQTEQPAQEPEQQTGTPVALFSKLFESREIAHIYHLQVNGQQGSHAAHVALNDYYFNVLNLIDDLIETYQGQYGIVDGYDVIDAKDTKTKEAVAYFEEVAEFIKHARKCISVEDTHLHNIIDEIVALIYKTLYKLKFTK